MSFFKRFFEASAKSIVRKTRVLEEQWREQPDEALRDKISELRERVASGTSVLDLIPETFACVVLASERTVGMRHFDVQLQGGVELARGRVVEMKTGEGKTLVATLPATLHALSGRGLHVVTVNDYLAHRDADWMGAIYELLGLSVGCIQEVMADDRAGEIEARREQYGKDITYVTNSEVVFDYLRDNLAYRLVEVVQRGAHFAIVDEVDLLLIDEAQTPLIISGPGHDDPTFIRQADAVIRGLDGRRHWKVDHKVRAASLTEEGQTQVEAVLDVGSLTDPKTLPWAHAIYQSLQAWALYECDVEYIVAGDEIHIVDEHTGRVSPEKRYSNGLHQALEAKEGVTIRSDDLTLAKTSFQYYFRGYSGLCGMTGTAWSEREELRKTYHLEVVRIPTHEPMIREDLERHVYLTVQEKYEAVIQEVLEAREEGRPVLVGTVSVEESEVLSSRLTRAKVKHEVLNARKHDREAQTIAQAGHAGAVTISTNMAGRGTDISLGGGARELASSEAPSGTPEYLEALRRHEQACAEEHDRIVEAGGLLVIGTGEHESARIDDQLRGRSGRQGDPGSSIYIVALEDPVYRRFGDQKVLPELYAALDESPEGEHITDHSVLDVLDELRRKVEIENQAIRLDVFKYDSVVHDRRERIWGWRRTLLETQSLDEWRESVRDMIDDLLERFEETSQESDSGVSEGSRPSAREQWLSILAGVLGWIPVEDLDEVTVVERDQAVNWLLERYEQRLGTPADEAIIAWERQVLLDVIDMLWPQYLNDLERVEQGIWMRSFAQIDPFVEFRKEAAVMYGGLMRDIELNALRAWLSVEVIDASGASAEPELPAATLQFEAGGHINPESITTSTRESTADPFGRAIPAPSQRKTHRR